MWQGLLQTQYAGRSDFAHWSDTYSLAERLGYASADEAWDANPFIQGSANPADYGKVDTSEFTDGEVIGIDRDDHLILWNATDAQPYNCGETVDSFHAKELTPREILRLARVSFL